MTNSILLAACAVVLAVPGKALGAQQLSRMRVGLPERAAAALAAPAVVTVSVAAAKRRPKRWPYVLGGAVVGAVGMGFWIAYGVAHTDDAMVFPPLVVAELAVGAGVGALGGLMISDIVHQ
jgi:hypothetical protein